MPSPPPDRDGGAAERSGALDGRDGSDARGGAGAGRSIPCGRDGGGPSRRYDGVRSTGLACGALYSRRGDRVWLLGCVLLFLAPSLVLFTVGLLAVGFVWLALWLVYVLFVMRHFPRVQTARAT